VELLLAQSQMQSSNGTRERVALPFLCQLNQPADTRGHQLLSIRAEHSALLPSPALGVNGVNLVLLQLYRTAAFRTVDQLER
jgi:hypothetical protein